MNYREHYHFEVSCNKNLITDYRMSYVVKDAGKEFLAFIDTTILVGYYYSNIFRLMLIFEN